MKIYSKINNFESTNKFVKVNFGNPVFIVENYINEVKNILDYLLVHSDLLSDSNIINSINLKISDIFYILENEKLDKSLRIKFIKIFKNSIKFENIEDLLVNPNIHTDILLILILNLDNNLDFYNDKVFNFILNGKVHYSLKSYFIKKIKGNLDFYDNRVQSFLTNQNILPLIRAELVEKLSGNLDLNNKNLYNFVTDMNISDEIKFRFPKKIKIDEKDLQKFLGDTNLESYFRYKFFISNPIMEVLSFLDEKAKNKINLKKLLFNVESSGSIVFENLVKEMEEEPRKRTFQLMKKNINNVFDDLVVGKKSYKKEDILKNGLRVVDIQKNEMLKKDEEIVEKLGLIGNKLELSLYARCSGNNIDYPEILDYIILFLEKYIKNNYSRYFLSIRIIPRNIDGFPNENITNSDIITKYNIEGEKFENALSTFAIPFSFSHGTNTKKYSTPNVSSFGTKIRKNDIKSKIELKKIYDVENFTSKSIIKEILKEILENMDSLEKELDKLI